MPRLAAASSLLLLALSAPAHAQDAVSSYWIHTPTGERTFVVGRDGTGRWVDGVQVLVDGAMVELLVEAVPVPHLRCEDDRLDLGAPPVTFLRLVALRGAERQVLLDAPHEGPTNAANDRIVVRASLGPYVAVERRLWQHACGAHGSGSRSVTWLDLRTGAPVAVDASGLPVDPGRLEADLRERYRLALEASQSDPSRWLPNGGPFEIAGVMPTFDGGRWQSEIVSRYGVPYAWSEGPTSYAIEATTTIDALPALVRPHAVVPPEVLSYLRAHPSVRLGGVSASRT
ncbi:MAG: hypothetical protein R3B82_12145 [Sandaracinaceae bacterium]